VDAATPVDELAEEWTRLYDERALPLRYYSERRPFFGSGPQLMGRAGSRADTGR